uniref:Uncharacterized protein n=1 Tax=Cyclophora tenuis TaxID=216820 RepID=A0A7S1CZH2_CYCTE|mmetsp:Transcript_16156/g.27366  ORF Transcript_16156/g.27366 Transcript_16156/m.27366 type:complete len:112 (+) Transcript_16156:993-1328(+)
MPTELGQLIELEDLTLTSNQLTGTIPSELGNCGKLRRLLLNTNFLQGTIPTELGQKGLETIDLETNYLMPPMPSNLCHLRLNGTLEVLSADFCGEGDEVPNREDCLHLCRE